MTLRELISMRNLQTCRHSELVIREGEHHLNGIRHWMLSTTLHCWQHLYTLWLNSPSPPHSYDCTVVSKNVNRFDFYNVTFGTRCTELICNITFINLPISLTYCCYTTLGNVNCSLDNTVRQHSVHVRWSSSFSVKLLNSFLRTSGFRIVLILVLLTVSVECRNMGNDARSCVSDASSRRWDSAWWTHGIACYRALWSMLLANGGRDFRPVL